MSNYPSKKTREVTDEIIGQLAPLTRRDSFWEWSDSLGATPAQAMIWDILEQHYAAVDQRPAGATAVEQGS